jgi:hypothetical protein
LRGAGAALGLRHFRLRKVDGGSGGTNAGSAGAKARFAYAKGEIAGQGGTDHPTDCRSEQLVRRLVPGRNKKPGPRDPGSLRFYFSAAP